MKVSASSLPLGKPLGTGSVRMSINIYIYNTHTSLSLYLYILYTHILWIYGHKYFSPYYPWLPLRFRLRHSPYQHFCTEDWRPNFGRVQLQPWTLGWAVGRHQKASLILARLVASALRRCLTRLTTGFKKSAGQTWSCKTDTCHHSKSACWSVLHWLEPPGWSTSATSKTCDDGVRSSFKLIKHPTHSIKIWLSTDQLYVFFLAFSAQVLALITVGFVGFRMFCGCCHRSDDQGVEVDTGAAVLCDEGKVLDTLLEIAWEPIPEGDFEVLIEPRRGHFFITFRSCLNKSFEVGLKTSYLWLPLVVRKISSCWAKLLKRPDEELGIEVDLIDERGREKITNVNVFFFSFR